MRCPTSGSVDVPKAWLLPAYAAAGSLAHPVLVGALGCGEFAGLLCCAVTDPAATTSANTPSAVMSERNMEDSFRPGVAARRLCVDVRHFDSYMVDILPSRRRSENRAHFGRGDVRGASRRPGRARARRAHGLQAEDHDATLESCSSRARIL